MQQEDIPNFLPQPSLSITRERATAPMPNQYTKHLTTTPKRITITSHNPMSIKRSGRMLGITLNLNTDVVSLQGTCTPNIDNPIRQNTFQQQHTFTAGCSIPSSRKAESWCFCIRIHSIRQPYIQRRHPRNHHLEGRALLVDVKATTTDIAFITFYPTPHDNQCQPTNTTKGMYKTLEHTVR